MAFEALLEYSRRTTDALFGKRTAARDAVDFAFDGGRIYNEAAFRHFLSLERRRAERASRSFLLLLVSVKDSSSGPHIAAPLATKLFSALATCVREVDFVGWYREERIAGAVLAQGPDAPGPDVQRLVAERVTSVLREHLPRRAADALRVRVLQVRRR